MITQATGWVALVAVKDESEADGLAVWTVPPGHGEIDNKDPIRIVEVPVAMWHYSKGARSLIDYFNGVVSWKEEMRHAEDVPGFIAYAREQKMPPLRQWKQAHVLLT